MEELFEAGFVRWIMITLKNHQRSSANGRTSRPVLSMIEGLLGLLLHFTRNLDPKMVIANHQLSSLVFMCGRPPPETSACPVHNAPCEDDNQLCLLKSNCMPLVDLLADEDTNVQIAAVEELSTLIIDTSKSLKRAIDELDEQGVLNAVIALFTEVRPGILQERTIWMIERILRVEGHRYSLNLSLVRALVEAFKRSNANTKKHAQDALTIYQSKTIIRNQQKSLKSSAITKVDNEETHNLNSYQCHIIFDRISCIDSGHRNLNFL
ncbi:hypothetical protein Q3G72_028263 [Acer saccharum]|nr:hypothetical protein Q3G72_028263 [Acer saccharum]